MTRIAHAIATTVTSFLILAGCGGKIEEVAPGDPTACGGSRCELPAPPEPAPPVRPPLVDVPRDAGGGSEAGYYPFDSGVEDAGTVVVPGSCAIVPGNYTVHFSEPWGGGPTCPLPQDQTVSITADELDASSPGCVTTVDTSSCTTTVDCTIESSGYTTTTHDVVTTNGGMVVGLVTTKTTRDADGVVIQECPALGFTYTKN